MIFLIGGSSHTGKTNLAQKLLERYKYPYLSIDHLKMGIIRSGYTNLTVEEDDKLTEYMWPILREMIKTAIENNQNLVIEGCYLPYNWRESFAEEYLKEIRFVCLIMTSEYIEQHFEDIRAFGSVIENRLDDEYCTKEMLLQDNALCREMCEKYGCEYILIKEKYDVEEILAQIKW
ncbi:MAG: adenylate kinase [Lachnospiraceae bacterium]|nr:adenylate kinase [Lachnospiraceae bacterium]